MKKAVIALVMVCIHTTNTHTAHAMEQTTKPEEIRCSVVVHAEREQWQSMRKQLLADLETVSNLVAEERPHTPTFRTDKRCISFMSTQARLPSDALIFLRAASLATFVALYVDGKRQSDEEVRHLVQCATPENEESVTTLCKKLGIPFGGWH